MGALILVFPPVVVTNIFLHAGHFTFSVDFPNIIFSAPHRGQFIFRKLLVIGMGAFEGF